MYALWMQKEIKTEYGYCKLEIYRKGIFDYVREITALSADSLIISLENLSTIIDPIGKSVCSFSIIDTDQISYDDFFTPDATAYKVVVSTRVGEGAYVARWSGFITPDFFAENLSYRTPISLTARDNIGYLADVDFDLSASTITVRELITAAFAKIAEPYPMSLVFATQKQTAEGVLAIDATISTALLRDMTWYEALETVLHDLGLQMRWVDNNTIAVIDVSQIPEYYATQGFNFIDASGYREILPAWRQLSQSQEYGLRENFFEGWLKSNNIRYVKSEVIRPPNATNWTTDIAWYVPNNWGVARDMFTIDPEYYGSKFNNKIFFTGASEEYPTTTYMSWRQSVIKSDKPMQIAFKAFNSILYPSQKYSNINTPSGRNLVAYNPLDEFLHSGKAGEFLQLGLKMNVFLHVGVDTYVLQGSWQQVSDSNKDWQLDFVLPKVELTSFDGPAIGVGPAEEEVTINMATVPYSGEIELRIYGYYIVDKHNYWEDEWTLNDYKFDWLKCVSYINEPVYTYNIENAETGQTAKTEIGPTHNVKDSLDYVFGQVPDNYGGINAFAGGLYRTDGTELSGFQRNAEGENYNLLELVGREVIHFNKKNYNKLSGTIKNLNKEPLMFNRLFVREGKTYAPFAYSLNVISNEMNITTMQEVEPYETASFTQIESEVTTGGATVGGGNNTVLQYTEKAGNAKRIYELNTATADEKNDGYLIIDNGSFGEAKKVHISEVKDAELRDDFNALEKEVEAITSMLGDDTEGVIDTWTEVVNFLNGYKESEDLATILSGINGDVNTLQGYFKDGIAKEAAKVSHAITFEGGAFSAESYNGSAAKTVKIPTTTEHITESGNNLFHTASRARAAITGAASSIVSSNLTENRALISNASGKVAVSAVTSTELGYLSGVTSKVQDQLKSITDRIDILEALGLSLVTKDGKTYVQSAYNFYSKGGLTAGGIGSGGGGGTGGGSNVSYKGELSSGMLLGTITIDGLANKIYGPSALSQLSNDAGYIKPNAAGNVLIGATTDDGNKLQIYDASFGDLILLQSNDTYAAALYQAKSGAIWAVGADYQNKFYWYNSAKSAVVAEIDTDGVFKASGAKFNNNIGIGKSAATAYSLDVLNTAGGNVAKFASNDTFACAIFLPSTGNQWSIGANNDNNFYFYSKNKEQIVAHIDENGALYTTSAYVGGKALLTAETAADTYLPLSGGTISNKKTDVLTIDSTSKTEVGVSYSLSNINKGWSGYTENSVGLYNYTSKTLLGIKDDGTPHYNNNTLIHSGNIGSQNVNYAAGAGKVASGSFTDANTVTYTDGSLRWFSIIPSTASNIPTYTGYQNGLLALPLHINGITAQWYFSYSKKPYYRSSQTSDWNEIAYVTDNVASATKLQTERRIWGQGFNGEWDIAATKDLYVNVIRDANGNYNFASDGAGNVMIGTTAASHSIEFCTTNGVVVKINNNGNVLIGTTTNSGNEKVKIYDKAIGDLLELNSGSDATYTALVLRPYNSALWSIGAGNDNTWYLYNSSIGTKAFIVDADGNITTRRGQSVGGSIKMSAAANTYYYSGIHHTPIEALCSDLSAGHNLTFTVGKANSAYNLGYFSYHHVGDGSTSNYIRIGLYSADDILNIAANKRVGINTTSPTNPLSIVRTDTSSGDVIDMTSKAGWCNIVYRSATSKAWSVGANKDSFYWWNSQKSGTVTYIDNNGNMVTIGGMTSGKASDRRLKQNIMNLQRTNAVNVLRTLRPVTFEWNATAYSLDQRNNGADVGFIADEYEGLIPNSGRAIWEKYRAIEYEKCIPHLVLGWQIHESRFETVEDRLAKAEGRIKELEAELKQYKTAA